METENVDANSEGGDSVFGSDAEEEKEMAHQPHNGRLMIKKKWQSIVPEESNESDSWHVVSVHADANGSLEEGLLADI